MTDEVVEISGWKIVRVMLKHVWPKDQPSLKARVVIAVGLLFGAKVCTVRMYNVLIIINNDGGGTLGSSHPPSSSEYFRLYSTCTICNCMQLDHRLYNNIFPCDYMYR